jgi:hypothetical protein
MAEFDPRRDHFVSPPRAHAEIQISARKFQKMLQAQARLPLYKFPRVSSGGSTIDRFLLSDLRCAAQGALL